MSEFPYTVVIHRYCVDFERSHEEYGDWSESWDNNFGNIRKGGQYPDVTSSIDFKPGDDVYILWVEWSTGDSFGHSYRGSVDTVAIFNNEPDAVELEKLIRKDNELGYEFTRPIGSGNRIRYQSKDGQSLDIYSGSWKGYFETLEDIHIEHTVMGLP